MQDWCIKLVTGLTVALFVVKLESSTRASIQWSVEENLLIFKLFSSGVNETFVNLALFILYSHNLSKIQYFFFPIWREQMWFERNIWMQFICNWHGVSMWLQNQNIRKFAEKITFTPQQFVKNRWWDVGGRLKLLNLLKFVT